MKKWFTQIVASIAYIHSHGVFHCDLRPDNFLLSGEPSQPDLRLCDFGGSTCSQLQIYSTKLPDSGFFNPSLTTSEPALIDIFSLGSMLYTITTGHWPFRGPGGYFESFEAMEEYETYVDKQFSQGIFPEVQGLYGEEIIIGCWRNEFSNVDNIVDLVDILPEGP